MHDFRTEPFEGSLLELLDECWRAMPTLEVHLKGHSWLLGQTTTRGNLLPVRKFATHSDRGAIHEEADVSYMPVDNEPLAALYKLWNTGTVPAGTVGEMLKSRTIPASWKCDVTSKSGMRFSGVSAPFRDCGLKLAHLHDAAAGLKKRHDADGARARFLRSLSPLNVFLFPSFRAATVSLLEGAEGWKPTRVDWAEDPWVRGIALGRMADWVGSKGAGLLEGFHEVFQAEIRPNSDWERLGRATRIRVEPGRQRAGRTARQSAALAPATACLKVDCGDAVTVDEAAAALRNWRSTSPTATQLDGGHKNNPSRWFHIRVDGYKSPTDDFTSRHGPSFLGGDYNGVVNFHGDCKVSAIDRFIELLEVAEDYRDVLRPSATYETKQSVPKNVRPKFALQGYEEAVAGFFLYHDEW